MVSSYWYGSNPNNFPMGTPMMPMNTNLMTVLPMPTWNMMTYPMLKGVCPSIPTTQVLVAILVPLNTYIWTMTQQKSMGVIFRSNDGQSSPPISPPLNSRREAVPQEPPHGRWFICTIYLI